jgi:hypothetical protein
VFLRVQGLAFFKQSANKDNARSTFVNNNVDLIVGLCILLRMYQSIYIETSVRRLNNVDVSNWYFYTRRYLLHSLSSVTSSSIAYMLDVLVICRSRCSPAAPTVINNCMRVTKTFMSLVNLRFLHCSLIVSFFKLL